MNCEDTLCIYQENGKCLLRQLSIDSLGYCSECIHLTFSEAELCARKRKEREELDW